MLLNSENILQGFMIFCTRKYIFFSDSFFEDGLRYWIVG